MTTYRNFVSQEMKKKPAGIKASEYMKTIAVKWHKSKGKGKSLKGGGEPLLLSPGLGNTSASYVSA